MEYSDLETSITTRRHPKDCFIKWWGTDAANADYDLIDHFLLRGEAVGEVLGFDLLNLEQMWQTFIGLSPDRLTRKRQGVEEVIEWIWSDRQWKTHTDSYPFTPEGLMKLMELGLCRMKISDYK